MAVIRKVASSGLVIGVVAATGFLNADVRAKVQTIASSITGGSSLSQSLSERWTTDSLTKALSAINDEIGPGPDDYVELVVNQVNVSVKAIDPDKRENVDQYDSSGAGVSVSPVDISSNEPGVIEESVFNSVAVKPEVLSAVLQSALKDSAVEGGSISALTVKKTWANDPEAIIAVPVSGPRDSKVVRYNLDGALVEVI